MKVVIFLVLAAGCAGNDRVRSFKDAVERDGEIRTGVYLNERGENVSVTTVNLRLRIQELENQLTDANRQTEFYKRRANEIELENLQLRVRANYDLSKDVKQVIGFDKDNNPIIRTYKVGD
jgi:hypothetical protein